jgi:hypothetical protein
MIIYKNPCQNNLQHPFIFLTSLCLPESRTLFAQSYPCLNHYIQPRTTAPFARGQDSTMSNVQTATAASPPQSHVASAMGRKRYLPPSPESQARFVKHVQAVGNTSQSVTLAPA